jgi:hypothetical protein
MNLPQRLAAAATLAAGALLASGCTTTMIVAHVLEQINEGEPSCVRLTPVERALQLRCGPYRPGTLRAADLAAPGVQICPLTLATREPRLWPVLPDLLALGAQPERCLESPLAALAQAQPCPDFGAAPAASVAALRWLAEADARSVQHDVVRMLSCPNARAARLDTVLDGWLAQGQLARGTTTFAPLGALHPTHLGSPLSAAMERQGHHARDALGAQSGTLPSGFDAALRNADFTALDWWLARAPELIDRVPARQGREFAWVPLARVITPGYMPEAQQRAQTTAYLLSRGADPSKPLPHDKSQSVLSLARQIGSPLVATLERGGAPSSTRSAALAAAAQPPAQPARLGVARTVTP